MNVFLFILFGFFLRWAAKRNVLQTVLIGLLFSVLIEAAQYAFRLGLCKFDDVFHNTLGTVLGCLYWLGLERLEGKLKLRKRGKREKEEGSGKMLQVAKTDADKQMDPVPEEHTESGGPLVSVIMGTYNCETTVTAAVRSILSQTAASIELIVCDDASTDGTYSVLRELADEAPDRIRLLRNEKNSYLANCLNRCLQEAKGRYIARMDGDDISFPERLERQVQYLESHPDIDMVGTGMRMIMDWGGTKDIYCPNHPDRNTLQKKVPFFHATVMARRSVFEKLDGYTEGVATKRSEDIDFYCKFFLAEMRGANLQKVLYLKSETDTSMKNRKPSIRFSSYKTKLRCFNKLNYPLGCYIRETLRLYKCLIPYPLLKMWRRLRQDRSQ